MSIGSSSSSSAARVPRITEALCLSLVQHAEELLDELARTQRAYAESPTSRSHGAFAFAVAQSQKLLRLLEAVRAKWQQERRGAGGESTAAPPPPSGTDSARPHVSPAPAVLATLEKKRLALRAALPRAVALLEEAGVQGAGRGAAAADVAASLRSLMHTRKMLSVEVQKVSAAVQRLSGSAETLGTVHQSLDEVHGAMESAQRAVRRLLTVQKREDAVLRLSALCFALVVGFVFLQRVCGFFPVTEYVTLD